jgi:DNA invertase Pin-like site-specific DNA recombinase
LFEAFSQGDTIVVWKLDRLARSLKQLIETIEELKAEKIGFRDATRVPTSRQPYPLSWDEQVRLFRELPAHLAEMALFAVNTRLSRRGGLPSRAGTGR